MPAGQSGPPSLSLFDLAGRRVTTWYVCYVEREEPRWWNKYLKAGFQHVQLWQPVQYGPRGSDTFWILLDPGMEFLLVGPVFRSEPPWASDPKMTVQRVVSVCTEKRVRNFFFFGPITCVEIAKACLGFSSVWVRTPLQLYKYIAARKCVLLPR